MTPTRRWRWATAADDFGEISSRTFLATFSLEPSSIVLRAPLKLDAFLPTQNAEVLALELVGWWETSGRVSFPIPISHSSSLSPRAFLEHNWKEVATGQKIGQRDRSLSTGINSAKFVANMT